MCRTVANCIFVEDTKRASQICWTFQTWLSQTDAQADQILKAEYEWRPADAANGMIFLEVYLRAGAPILIESQIFSRDRQLRRAQGAQMRFSLEQAIMASMPPLSDSLPAVVERYIEEDTLDSLFVMARGIAPDSSAASIAELTAKFDLQFGDALLRHESA